MSKIICVLEVIQNSPLEQEIHDSHIISGSYMVWEDTGTLVTYPILASTDRKRKCIENSYYELFFNNIAQKYQDNVKFVDEKASPPWGNSWWAADAVGLIKLYKSNWDSSD